MNTRGVRIDHDDGHRAIGRTDGMKPHIAHAGDLRAVTPGPLALMLQITPSDLAPVWQSEDIRTFPFYEQGALVRRGHVAHELRIAESAIRDDHRRMQLQAEPTQGRHAPVQHNLQQAQFVSARPPKALRVRPPDGKVHRHHQFAIADDHD
jgi:hypothetical protein